MEQTSRLVRKYPFLTVSKRNKRHTFKYNCITSKCFNRKISGIRKGRGREEEGRGEREDGEGGKERARSVISKQVGTQIKRINALF